MGGNKGNKADIIARIRATLGLNHPSRVPGELVLAVRHASSSSPQPMSALRCTNAAGHWCEALIKASGRLSTAPVLAALQTGEED